MPLRWEGLIEWLGPASLPSETGINNRPAITRTGEGCRLEKEMQPVIRARRVHHGGFLHGARRALVVSTSRLDAAVVAKGR